MTEFLNRWTEIAETRGLRLLAIVIIALIVARTLKAITNRLVESAKSPHRAAQMREQQTRTMAGILYSAGIFIIVAVSILTALPEFVPSIANCTLPVGVPFAPVTVAVNVTDWL